MTNVFIMHTQYSILLARAVSLQFFSQDENILFLHSEFTMNDKFTEKLEKVFSRVVVLQDRYIDNHRLNAFKCFKRELGIIKKTNLHDVDRIIFCQDNYLDTLIAKKILKDGGDLCSVEEDSYYSLKIECNDINYKFPPKTLLQRLYYLSLYICFGKNDFYEHYHCYAKNSRIKDMFVLFPDNVRKELANKNLIGISKEKLKIAIDEIYGTDKTETSKRKKIIFMFDLLSRYENVDDIEKLITKIIQECEKNKIEFYFKFHPRETSKVFDILKSSICKMIPTNLPSEKFISEKNNENAILIGNATTALQVALFMGLKVVSISQILGTNNNTMVSFYRKIGIYIPKNIEELMDYLFY